MTHFHWIILVWSVGTCIATLMLVFESEDSEFYKKQVEQYTNMFSSKFITVMFYITAFVHSFFWWWLTIPKMTFEWLRWQLIFMIANRILKMAERGEMGKVAKLYKTLKKVSPKKDGEEKEEDQNVV